MFKTLLCKAEELKERLHFPWPKYCNININLTRKVQQGRSHATCVLSIDN